VHQRDPVGEVSQPGARDVQRGRVAIEADQLQARQVGQEPLGVPARAEGGVDENSPGTVRVVASQRGGEQPNATVQQDGHMAEIV
jgi:hypothetical protein